MAGLLDFEDPNTAGAMQLGLGLLNAGGPSRMPVSLGQGIAQGGTMAMDAMRQARQDLLKKKLAELEIEKGQLSMDQVKEELAADKKFVALWEKTQTPKAAPNATPYGGGYSPAVSEAFGGLPAAPQTAPQQQNPASKHAAMLEAARQSGSLKLYQKVVKMIDDEQKLAPKYGNTPVTMMKNGVPVSVRTADDGTMKEIEGGYAPAEPAHFADVGGTISPLNRFTGAPIAGSKQITKSLTPDQAATLPIQRQNANTAAGQLGLGRDRYNFESSPEKQGKIAGAKSKAQKMAEIEVAPIEAGIGAGKALDAAGYDPKTKTDNITKWLDGATGGFFGTTIDTIVGSTGFSMPGEQANAKLKSAANKIVMDMMGGKLGSGISNADRDFITDQLGQVGNSMIPTETRRAAWNSVKDRLNETRKKGSTGGGTGEWSVVE